jgi:hypothetical protein
MATHTLIKILIISQKPCHISSSPSVTCCFRFRRVNRISCSTTPMWWGQIEPSNMFRINGLVHIWTRTNVALTRCLAYIQYILQNTMQLNVFQARRVMWRFVTSGDLSSKCQLGTPGSMCLKLSDQWERGWLFIKYSHPLNKSTRPQG